MVGTDARGVLASGFGNAEPAARYRTDKTEAIGYRCDKLHAMRILSIYGIVEEIES